jgi:valyl-tRNA synthetase
LRFFMAAMESQGRDIKMDEARLAGYRNFATKIWNAARFLQGNEVGASQSIAAPSATLPVNRWIVGEVVDTLAKLDKALADLRFDEAASTIYHFTWATFCDWYVELVKGAWDDETRAVAAWAFDQILVMLHPFMPFITEELWHSMGERPYDLIVAKWPAPEASRDELAQSRVSELISLIAEVRSVRAEFNLPWSERLRLQFTDDDDNSRTSLFEFASIFSRMTKADFMQMKVGVYEEDNHSAEPANRMFVQDEKGIQIVVNGKGYIVVVPNSVDLDAEKSRLAKAIAVAEKDRDGLANRLNNPAFAERAKPEAVAKAREDHDARAAEAERLSAALARLG